MPFARLPKVELHVHLEGSIPEATMWQLVEKYGGLAGGVNALRERLAYRDFAHFIETWIWHNQFLREYEDFTLIATGFATELVAHNVVYAEAFFSPSDYARHGLTPQGLVTAIREGLDRVEGVEVGLIADVVRDAGVERAGRTLSEVAEVQEHGVIGIGLGGSEAEFPPELFATVYDDARDLGFRTTAHAGEAAGPASIWGALRELRVERIGHGVRAIEDPALVEELARRRIPLEVCPMSNVRTGVVRSIEEHPIRSLIDAGVLVTINSDDPAMFGTTISNEYRVLHERLGFDFGELRQVAVNAAAASFLPDDRRRALVTLISDGWNCPPSP